MPDIPRLRSIITGFQLSAALNVAAELGLSDLLASGPRTVTDLAAETSTDEDTLAPAAARVVHDRGLRRTARRQVREHRRSVRACARIVPGTLRPLARTLRAPAPWAAWGHLGHSVRTGENAFEALHGVDVWTHRRASPGARTRSSTTT